MYIACAVLSVPEENKSAYIEAAEFMANWCMEYGALEVMEAWEKDVPDGKITDYKNEDDDRLHKMMLIII